MPNSPVLKTIGQLMAADPDRNYNSEELLLSIGQDNTQSIAILCDALLELQRMSAIEIRRGGQSIVAPPLNPDNIGEYGFRITAQGQRVCSTLD